MPYQVRVGVGCKDKLSPCEKNDAYSTTVERAHGVARPKYDEYAFPGDKIRQKYSCRPHFNVAGRPWPSRFSTKNPDQKKTGGWGIERKRQGKTTNMYNWRAKRAFSSTSRNLHVSFDKITYRNWRKLRDVSYMRQVTFQH